MACNAVATARAKVNLGQAALKLLGTDQLTKIGLLYLQKTYPSQNWNTYGPPVIENGKLVWKSFEYFFDLDLNTGALGARYWKDIYAKSPELAIKAQGFAQFIAAAAGLAVTQKAQALARKIGTVTDTQRTSSGATVITLEI